jgi:hypothetical protein
LLDIAPLNEPTFRAAFRQAATNHAIQRRAEFSVVRTKNGYVAKINAAIDYTDIVTAVCNYVDFEWYAALTHAGHKVEVRTLIPRDYYVEAEKKTSL